MRKPQWKLPLTFLIAFILLIAIACAPTEQATETDSSTEEQAIPTDAPALEAVATDPPATAEPVATDPPAEDTADAVATPASYPIGTIPPETPEAPEAAEESEPDAYPAGDQVIEVQPVEAYPADGQETDEAVVIAPVVEAYPVEDEAATSGLAPQANLDGTSWYLIAFVESGVATQPIEGTELTIEFVGEQVNGKAGCNTFFGPYMPNGNNLTFGELASTRIACEDAIQQQESRLLQTLGLIETFSIENQTLSLQHPSGTLQFMTVPILNDGSEPAPTADVDIKPALVESFTIDIDQVNSSAAITLVGYYTDGCTEFSAISQSRESETEINFTMLTQRPLDVVCTQAIVPFEETYPLNISALEAGTYKIFVNDLEGEFTLE